MYARIVPEVPGVLFDDFAASLQGCASTTDLLTAEARFAKALYGLLARLFDVADFTRDAGAKKKDTPQQRINSLLDHGNYLAYGYAAVALHGMGIPYFLPVLHGKTRRGALVFDVADLFKDWLVMPAAFRCGASNAKENVFRAQIIEAAIKHDVLDHAMTFISDLPEKIVKNQQDTNSASN
jgi:CRISPR-associated protein Cas1